MDAFAYELHKIYPKELIRIARMINRDRESAEDLMQDAVKRAVEARESFVSGTNMRAWMYVIMRNLFVTQMRRKRLVLGSLDDPELSSWHPRMHGNQESSFELQETIEAFDQLAPTTRELLRLVGIEQHSYDEAAKMLGMPVGTAKSRVTRGRQRLRTMRGLVSGPQFQDVAGLLPPPGI